MKEKALLVAKYAAYPAFYLFSLFLFGYLTFPFDRLKDRIIVEFEKSQRKGSIASSGPHLAIDKLDSYWFTGVKLKGVRLTLAPDEPAPAMASMASLGSFGGSDSPKKDVVVAIDQMHVRVRILPLLIGRVRLDFGAEAFGGDIDGTVPVGGSSGTVELELEKVDLGQVAPLVDAIGLPLKGIANGKLELTANEGKFNKSNGSFDLTIADVAVGDGKTKLKGIVAVPEAKIGEIAIAAEAKDGVLKVTKLNAAGHDLEVTGEGKVQIREPWNSSNADLYIRFKFADAYRTKNEDTKSLLGDPNSSAPALLEMDPKMKRAKRSDGFYGWHIHGMLRHLQFDPWTADTPTPGGAAAGGKPSKKPETPAFPGIKRPIPGFSGGMPQEGEAVGSPMPQAPPPQPPPPMEEPPRRAPAVATPEPPPQPPPPAPPPPPPPQQEVRPTPPPQPPAGEVEAQPTPP